MDDDFNTADAVSAIYELVRFSNTEINVAAYIQQQGEGGRVVIAAPLTLGRGQGIIEKLTLLLSDGLMRVWTKGETRLIEDILPQVDEKRPDESRW